MNEGLVKLKKIYRFQKQIAQAIGCSENTVSLWYRGDTKISIGMALKIVDATEGEVTVRDLVPWISDFLDNSRNLLNKKT